MMEYEEQLKLQAYLDGELPEAEARAFADQLARDPEAGALLQELRQTRDTVAGFEKEIRVPESREFYWSKIQREIRRQELSREEPSVPVPAWMLLLRRILMPATAIAVLAFLVLTASRPGVTHPSDTALDDSGAFTYHDYAGGATFVWLSYPAENSLADDEAAMFE